MFSRRVESPLELAVNKALRELDSQPIGSAEYVKILDQTVKLHKMKEEERPPALSRDTLVLVGSNLLGIVMVIKHEHVNVIMSKAMNLLLKPR